MSIFNSTIIHMKKLLTATLLMLCLVTARAQKVSSDVTFGEALKEMMQIKYDGNQTQLLLWLPQEFWDVMVNSDPSFSQSVANLIKETFKDYTLMMVKSSMDVNGNDVYPSYAEVKKNLVIVDGANKHLVPLEDNELSETMRLFKKQLEPVLSNLMSGKDGNGGHIYFYFFRAGVNTNVATQKGSFKVILNKSIFEWNLPIGLLSPPKFCPTDHAKMHGDWSYCPITALSWPINRPLSYNFTICQHWYHG